MTGRNIFTPRTAEGERLKLHVSDADKAKIGHGQEWSATVTDLDTGLSYDVRDADCGSPGCRCDALVLAVSKPKRRRRRALSDEARVEVVDALGGLYSAVKGLLDVYERNPELNDLQPKSMERILPMSIDDWLAEIPQVQEDWRANVGLYDFSQLNANFEVAQMGGGCTAWRCPLDDGGFILVTDGSGAGIEPEYEDDEWLVGYYARGTDDDEGEVERHSATADAVADVAEMLMHGRRLQTGERLHLKKLRNEVAQLRREFPEAGWTVVDLARSGNTREQYDLGNMHRFGTRTEAQVMEFAMRRIPQDDFGDE